MIPAFLWRKWDVLPRHACDLIQQRSWTGIQTWLKGNIAVERCWSRIFGAQNCIFSDPNKACPLFLPSRRLGALKYTTWIVCDGPVDAIWIETPGGKPWAFGPSFGSLKSKLWAYCDHIIYVTMCYHMSVSSHLITCLDMLSHVVTIYHHYISSWSLWLLFFFFVITIAIPTFPSFLLGLSLLLSSSSHYLKGRSHFVFRQKNKPNHQESEHGLGRQQDSHFGLLDALVVENTKG